MKRQSMLVMAAVSAITTTTALGAGFALYESDLIDFSELLPRLKVRKLTDQVLFHTERSLSILKYIGSEVVQCPQKLPRKMSGC